MTCDWFFFRNRIVAVVWWWDAALTWALALANIASKVYLILPFWRGGWDSLDWAGFYLFRWRVWRGLRRGVVKQQLVVLAALQLLGFDARQAFIGGQGAGTAKLRGRVAAVVDTPVIKGRSISFSIKLTSTSWPMRGTNWCPKPAPALGRATRNQQLERSSMWAPDWGCSSARCQWNWIRMLNHRREHEIILNKTPAAPDVKARKSLWT